MAPHDAASGATLELVRRIIWPFLITSALEAKGMAPVTQYKLISGGTPMEFSENLRLATAEGWKPILLTSATPNTTIPTGMVVIAAIMEKQG